MNTKVMILCVLLGLASAGAARAQQPADAASLYTKNCASCHGAKGTPAPSMVQSMHVPDFAAATLASIPDSALKNTVANGKGRMMPPYKARLTAEQITSLVTYIRTFSRH